MTPDEVLDVVAPVLSKPMADLVFAALGVADDKPGWMEKLQTASDAFIEAIGSSPDVFYSANRLAVELAFAERAHTLEDRLHRSDWIVCGEALRILTEGEA